MSHERLAAIDTLCEILSRLPGSETENAVGLAALAVGMEHEPTGLQPTIDRTFKQLYWDITPDDLRQHLNHLVNSHHIAQEIIVKGLVAHLESWYELYSDPEFAKQKANRDLDKIESLKETLKIPVDTRIIPIPDNQLRDLISQLAEMIETSESRRIQAENALAFLRAECDRVFTKDFWRSQRFGYDE